MMSGGHEMAQHLRGQELGRGNRCNDAAGTPKIAPGTALRKRAGLYLVTPGGGEPIAVYATGREAWALERLGAAGQGGCTPITEPAPRWSSYVHKLRARGLPIETIREPHGGAFPGQHGRYVLHAKVQKGAGYE